MGGRSNHNGVPKPPPGLDKFDGLMRRLVKVPKAELDAEVKKHERRKKRRAAKRG